MRIKELKLIGFKSFARKTVFKFNDGEITGVVGPNGSGKSNIVDALRWVLGEQRVGTLRSEKMENVIFNGGSKQKPLGMAEVSLTIENDKGVLALDYQEVVITRRLFRSGESQYFLNGTKCRLKDIITLLMDTGIGPDAYSVIELKMVESILSQNRQERRQLFEEAAGITRYKKSRQSALRKLDATRDDLTRLNDIILEIEKNVRSLSRQVSKVKRFKGVKDQLKQLEITRAHWRFHLLLEGIKPIKDELKNLKSGNAVNTTQLSLDQDLLDNYQKEIITIEENLRMQRETLKKAESQIEEYERQQLVEDERKQSNLRNLDVFKQEIKEIHNKLKDVKSRKNNWQNEITNLEDEAISFKNRYDDTFEEIQKLEEVLKNSRVEIEERQGFLNELQKDLNNLTEEKNKYQYKADQLEINSKAIQSQLEQSKSDIESNINKLEESKKDNSKLIKNKEKVLVDKNKGREVITGLEEKTDHIKEEILLLKSQIKDNENQFQFYTDLTQNFTGFSDSVKKVMKVKENFGGLKGPLAAMVFPPKKWENAVETILADLANVIVVESDNDQNDVLKFIGTDQNTFMFSLERIKKYMDFPKLPQPVLPSGKAFFFNDEIAMDPSIKALVQRLFGNVILCDNLEEAKKLWDKFQDYIFVTASGEVVYTGGIVKAGSRESSHLTGREHLLEKLQKSMESFRKALLTKENDLEALLQKIDGERKRQNSDENALQTIEEELLKNHSAIIEIETIVMEKTNTSESAIQRLAEMTKEKELLSSEMKEIAPSLEKLVFNEEDLVKEIESLESELKASQAKYESLSNIANEARLNLVQKQGALEQLNNQLKNSDAMNVEYLGTLHRRESDLVRIENENIQFEQNKIDREGNLIDLWGSRDKQSEDLRKEEDQLENARSKAHKTEEQLRQFRQAHEIFLEKRQTLELNVHDAEIRAGHISDQIREKYQTEISEEKPQGEMALEQAEMEIEKISRKLELMGEVNPLALEEYEKENDRLQFLLKQRSDLLEAEKKLLDTIKTINETATIKFNMVFEDIKNNFSRVFHEFFKEGEGTLLLEENVDPLEANIEISVRPKGRRPQTINLMSSGEKTLTAISLLFSIYLVKASPFCILDEVDAPLDDINIGRFTQAIRRFSDETQFILVTHNKKTMDVLDAIYGITQEEAGVSKVVSVDFRKISLN